MGLGGLRGMGGGMKVVHFVLSIGCVCQGDGQGQSGSGGQGVVKGSVHGENI